MNNIITELYLADYHLLKDILNRVKQTDTIILPMAENRDCAPGRVISRIIGLENDLEADYHKAFPEEPDDGLTMETLLTRPPDEFLVASIGLKKGSEIVHHGDNSDGEEDSDG